MLDNLYSNIGAKIKSWAKWICVVETISAIIGGITLMAEEEFLYGLLCLIIGPIVAFVSTWLLYAFGEIAEDIGLMRQKYVGDKVIGGSNGGSNGGGDGITTCKNCGRKASLDKLTGYCKSCNESFWEWADENYFLK